VEPWLLSILLLLLGVTFIVLEVFVPSGSVLSWLAAVSIIAAIIVAFVGESMLFGAVMLAVTALVLPIVIAGAIRVWPSTPIGRRILLGRPTSEDVLPDGELFHAMKSLVGSRGKAKTNMLPGGIVVIDGREFDAISVGMAIDKGQSVRVVAVEASYLVVRPIGDEEPPAPPESARTEKDLLSRPLDALGIDPFDDPLA
jgi:membrane-bound ClpP family serine protease